MNKNIDNTPTKTIDAMKSEFLDHVIELINDNIVIIEEEDSDAHDDCQRRSKYKMIPRENLIPIYIGKTFLGYYYIPYVIDKEFDHKDESNNQEDEEISQ